MIAWLLNLLFCTGQPHYQRDSLAKLYFIRMHCPLHCLCSMCFSLDRKLYGKLLRKIDKMCSKENFFCLAHFYGPVWSFAPVKRLNAIFASCHSSPITCFFYQILTLLLLNTSFLRKINKSFCLERVKKI